MPTFTARDAKNRFGEVLEESQRAEVIVTRNGRPFARVLGVHLDEKSSVDALQRQQRRLLSFLDAGDAKPAEITPENRVRSLREEW